MAARVTISDAPSSGTTRDQLQRELLALRGHILIAIKLIFGAFSLILALAALFVVLGRNVSSDNPIVRFVWNVAGIIDGPFSRDGGIFRFHGAKGAKLDAVVNWGIAALIYSVVGNVFRWLILPRKL